MTHHNHQRAFTLVELMLSMAFISLLLLSIALLVLQVTSVYNKGLTLRAVNQSGQQISSDIERSLAQSNPDEVKSVLQESGGRFCIGSLVYAWNYGKTIKDGLDNPLNVYTGSTAGERSVYLAKFQSSSDIENSSDVEYCEPDNDGDYENIPDSASELLTGDDRQLAVHKFTINKDNRVRDDPTQLLYQVTLRIGTSEDSILESNDDKFGCEAPISQLDDEYCAVNEFMFIARSGNKEVTSE